MEVSEHGNNKERRRGHHFTNPEVDSCIVSYHVSIKAEWWTLLLHTIDLLTHKRSFYRLGRWIVSIFRSSPDRSCTQDRAVRGGLTPLDLRIKRSLTKARTQSSLGRSPGFVFFGPVEASGG